MEVLMQWRLNHVHKNSFMSGSPSGPCKRIDVRTGEVVEIIKREPLVVEKITPNKYAFGRPPGKRKPPWPVLNPGP
jgi:hypothetical protein